MFCEVFVLFSLSGNSGLGVVVYLGLCSLIVITLVTTFFACISLVTGSSCLVGSRFKTIKWKN